MTMSSSSAEPRLPDPLRQRSEFLNAYVVAAEEKVAEPFRGVTADGNALPGLYSIQSTGVSTAPILEAARAWLASLSAEQRQQATFTVDHDNWRRWSNIHPPLLRHGVCLMEATDSQRQRAYDLLAA